MKAKSTGIWNPDYQFIKSTNIYKSLKVLGLKDYSDFYQWSIQHRGDFWEHVIKMLNVRFTKNYQKVLDESNGPENPVWLKGGELNIVDSCFQHHAEAAVIVHQGSNGSIQRVTQQELQQLVNSVCNGLTDRGLKKGDGIALDMPMTLEAVAIYLAGIKAGLVLVTIADSFSSDEIKARLELARPKLMFTQDVIIRKNKKFPLLERIRQASSLPCVVIPVAAESPRLNSDDQLWEQFLSSNTQYDSVSCQPDDPITILFSSGTTGKPKAIPWDHTTPIKAASDGYFHQDIQPGSVVCWPTNLGWMMGPWLVFATLINKGTIALYAGAPIDQEFGSFVEEAKVTVLGTIPSLVTQWKASRCMESCDWSSIRCFTSTGECSNPDDMTYLMELGGHKPVIEYCGGTEVGGAYVTGTLVQPSMASTFSTPALGTEFVLLNDEGHEVNPGEVFLLPPAMGLSTRLLGRDHHQVYYEGTPGYEGRITRRHGDQLVRLENGYYRALGRVDDAMNLGGIKISAVQIEEVINQLAFVRESAAIAVPPPGGGPDQLVLYLVVQQELPFEKMFDDAKIAIRERLNPLFKLADLRTITELPRTASNKVMRRKLKDLYTAGMV